MPESLFVPNNTFLDAGYFRRGLVKNKVSLQASLERNPTNSSYIFILSVNFENLTVRLHVPIKSLMLIKFQENQILIAMSSNKCYNFKFL